MSGKQRSPGDRRDGGFAARRPLLVVAGGARGGGGLGPDEAVVFKPAGLSSERGANDAGESLATQAQRELGWQGCWLPHRLDRPTRGLMVVCGSAEAAARCSEELRTGAWTKWYIARVPLRNAAGASARDLIGAHKAYLKRVGRIAQSVRSGGDPSRLEVLAVEPATDDPTHAHALVRLDTGRYHQIRVMLASLGFALVGDADYGGAPNVPARIDLESVALRIKRGDATFVHRLAVHPDRVGVGPALESALDDVLSGG